MTPTHPNNNNEDYSFSLSAVVHDTPSHAVTSADGLDSILAKELYGMSVRDRDITQEEIHGIRSVAQEESAEMTDHAFGSFQKEIEKIPTKHAYDMAVASNSYYVLHDRDFRIRFLRADLFDTKKAAARFINHLDLLLDYVGPIALQRPLRFSDLGKDVQRVLRFGSTQILPSRDRADRLILFFHRTMLGVPIRTRVSWVRLFLYFR